jgi:hypothetical protein
MAQQWLKTFNLLLPRGRKKQRGGGETEDQEDHGKKRASLRFTANKCQFLSISGERGLASDGYFAL